MNHRPLISVIVPSFNYGRFISEALESVRAQTLQDWECLVVDDGSSDNTRDVVERYCRRDSRIRYFHQENSGPSKARNTGALRSSGTYIQFLDADDLLESKKLALQVAYLETHSEIDIVYGEVRYFTDADPNQRLYSMWERDEPWMPKVSGRGKPVLEALIQDNIMTVDAPLLRKSVIKRVGKFDESLEALEDWEYLLRCALKGVSFGFDGARETYALVRSHGLSASRDTDRTLTAAIIIRERLDDLLEDAELRRANEKRLTALKLWRDTIASAAADITKVIPPDQPFILVDEDQVSRRLPKEYISIPFLERNGQYWGRPADDAAAIRELERLRANGARFIVFAYPAFWWLDYYSGFRGYLYEHYECCRDDERLVVFAQR